MVGGLCRLAPFGLLSLVLLVPLPAGAQEPVTLDAALREADSANALLPVARYGVAAAGERVRAAEGLLWPSLSVGGDIHDGTPSAYAAGDARLQLIADQVIYDGGARRAGLRARRAEVRSARARYRVAEKDLHVAVRARFSEFLTVQDELAIRREGIARLETYLSGVEARQAAGQGVAGDILRTRVRLGAEQANVTDAERRLAEARLELNDLLGRDPAAPLVLAPLPPPAPPPSDSGDPWADAPDIHQAAAEHDAAVAAVGIARAGRRPALALSANAGAQPLFGGATSGSVLNTGRGLGLEVTLSLAWPVWDKGVYGARLAEARIAAQQTEQIETAVRRQSRLAWRRAVEDLRHAYEEVGTRARTVPVARDSYLQAESLYRGGGATTLEVLDAYTAWIDASDAYARAVLTYHLADAQLERWSTP
jgi:outer membrane protein